MLPPLHLSDTNIHPKYQLIGGENDSQRKMEELRTECPFLQVVDPLISHAQEGCVCDNIQSCDSCSVRRLAAYCVLEIYE